MPVCVAQVVVSANRQRNANLALQSMVGGGGGAPPTEELCWLAALSPFTRPDIDSTFPYSCTIGSTVELYGTGNPCTTPELVASLHARGSSWLRRRPTNPIFIRKPAFRRVRQSRSSHPTLALIDIRTPARTSTGGSLHQIVCTHTHARHTRINMHVCVFLKPLGPIPRSWLRVRARAPPHDCTPILPTADP